MQMTTSIFLSSAPLCAAFSHGAMQGVDCSWEFRSVCLQTLRKSGDSVYQEGENSDVKEAEEYDRFVKTFTAVAAVLLAMGVCLLLWGLYSILRNKQGTSRHASAGNTYDYILDSPAGRCISNRNTEHSYITPTTTTPTSAKQANLKSMVSTYIDMSRSGNTDTVKPR